LTVTGIEAEDTILKVLVFDGTTAIPTDVTAHATITEQRASGTLTLAGIVAADVVSVNGKAYTFVANPGFAGNLGPYQVPVGATDTLSAVNLKVAIMSGDSAILATSSGAVVTIIWRLDGTAGNAIALAVTASNGHATRSGALLTGGSATSTITITDATTSNWVLVFWYNKTA
jgi:phage tail sheath gpL-like